MDINQVTSELDELFAQEKIDEIPQFLESHIAQAMEEGARDIVLTLYNETIGFYRETGQYELSIENCHKAIALMDDMGLQDTIPYATTLLNAANAHRAAGLLQESLELYNKVRPIYVSLLKEDDMYFASYYNNLSLLYQEMGDYASAKEQLENALYIVNHKPDKQFEVAVTQANLANTCIELELDDEAKARAEEAIRVFEELGVDDAHYSAALSALGSLYYMEKDYQNALQVMEKARDCVAKYLGTDNIQYQRLTENIKIINDKKHEKEREETEAEENTANTENVNAFEVSEAAVEPSVTTDVEAENIPETEASTDTSNNIEAENIPETEATTDTSDIEAANTPKIETEDKFSNSNIETTNTFATELAVESSDIETANVFKQEAAVEPTYTEAMKAPEEDTAVEPTYTEAMKAPEAKPVDESTYAEATEAPEVKPAVEPVHEEAMKAPEAKPSVEPTYEEALKTPEAKTTVEPIYTESTPSPEQTDSQNGGEKSLDTMTAVESNASKVDSAIENPSSEMTGLELCRLYYETYGKPLIAEKFHAYESVIAVGLVGKGSDCFGFDDIQSRDHDFGPRFFLWVTKKTYSEIGQELQQAYEKLPRSFMGVERIETFHGKDRGGVMVIEEFYKNVLGHDLIGTLAQSSGNDRLDKESLSTIKSWLAVHDYALAAAVNGEVFRDDEGIFTRYRNKLMSYYPKAVWYRKIAQTCALFSQSGQYNLPRMRKRGQLVAAELSKAECTRQAMKLYYLLNKKYAPHDKWLYKGMPDNAQMTIRDESGKTVHAAELVERLSLLSVDEEHESELTRTIESLAVIFANALERKNMIGQCNLYLDASTKELTAKSDALLTAIVADTPIITALSLSIAKAEFEAFDKVKNEGGRASCQNNWPTFKVMRMSQYMTWTEDMLLQYLYEFRTNYENGRNMIEEKYARMMESTAPLEYAQFADKLPPISEDKKAVMEQIIGFQVKWMEDFAAAYPKLAGNARAIHTSEDLPYDTSYETYLRGELGTYSDRMLEMYGRYIVGYAQSGKNATCEIMKNTVRFYGYKDLETANQHGI